MRNIWKPFQSLYFAALMMLIGSGLLSTYLALRLAADHVGATAMDRPEWGAVHPQSREVYFTLTNNVARTPEAADAANPRGILRVTTLASYRTDNPVWETILDIDALEAAAGR